MDKSCFNCGSTDNVTFWKEKDEFFCEVCQDSENEEREKDYWTTITLKMYGTSEEDITEKIHSILKAGVNCERFVIDYIGEDEG